MVDDNNTVVSNITNAIDDNNRHFMANTKYNYNDDLLSPERITTEINLRIDHEYTMKQIKKKTKLSVPVAAFIEYLLDLFKFSFDGNNNIKGERGNKAVAFYRRTFRPGTIGFEVPYASSMDPRPCPHYKTIEGRMFYFVNWHLNIPGIDLRCNKYGDSPYNTCHGRFIHQSSYDYKDSNAVTIVLDSNGNTNYAISMRYRCNRCNKKLKGNDGELYGFIPYHHRRGYNVDPRYAIGERHLTTSVSNQMERLMVKDGSGDLISHMLHETRGKKYEDVVLAYYSQLYHESDNNNNVVPKELITEQEYQGKYTQDGAAIRDLYKTGAYSNRTLTRTSDYMRHTRELQSVGCNDVAATDLTYAVNKNYRKGVCNDGKACTSTITTGEGFIASACIVPNGKTESTVHQLESFTRRDNVNLKVFVVTDNMPNNIELFRAILGDIKYCLGYFHFMQRIVKTLVEGHCDFTIAIWSLQRFLVNDDPTNMDDVKRALREGLLGGNEKKSDKDINNMMDTFSWNSNYRKYIRMYLKSAPDIIRNLKQWQIDWSHKIDPNTGLRLLTDATTNAIRLGCNNVKYLVAGLKNEEKYIEVKPSKKSYCRLSTYINLMGAEQKGEHHHLHLAHFANGGMNYDIADAIEIAGMCGDNTRLREKLRIGKLDEDKRSNINAAFHSWPSHYNNQLLMLINNLATATGATPPFEYAIKLPSDNGERFMSGYLTQITDIEKLHGSLQAEQSVRCPCKKCFNNPTALPHLESSSASLEHPQQQVSASASLPPQRNKQQHKRKAPKKRTAQILPSVVQTIPMPQLIRMQQQQMYFNNNSFILFLQQQQQQQQQQMYCNLLPQLPMTKAPSTQYNNVFCCTKYAEHRRLQKKGRPPHSKDCQRHIGTV